MEDWLKFDIWFEENYSWLERVFSMRLNERSIHGADWRVIPEDWQKFVDYNEDTFVIHVLKAAIAGVGYTVKVPNGKTVHHMSGFIELVGRYPKEGEFKLFYKDERLVCEELTPYTVRREGHYTIGISPRAFITSPIEESIMLQQHTTQEGRRMLIAEMTDEHLYNTVHQILQTAIDAKETLDRTATVDKYNSALYGITPATPENVADIVRQAITRSYPYLAECYLRGIDTLSGKEVAEDSIHALHEGQSLREMLHLVTGRSGALETQTPSQMLLGEGKRKGDVTF